MPDRPDASPSLKLLRAAAVVGLCLAGLWDFAPADAAEPSSPAGVSADRNSLAVGRDLHTGGGSVTVGLTPEQVRQYMLEVLRQASATVFVPLTIGGGIRDTVDPETGRTVPALEVATLYFQSGADKVSIGSDACDAAEEYLRAGKKLSGKTAIESISEAYGAQAVVVSIDPKRVYVDSPSATTHNTVETSYPGPNGEKYCWYACTAKGGRETRDLDVVQLATAVEAMGAGELLLNCIDKDGTNSGFDLELIRSVKGAVRIPVIASSGAGNAGHFAEVFEKTPVDAALGAGMFHRGEWTVKQVKEVLEKDGLVVRPFEQEI